MIERCAPRGAVAALSSLFMLLAAVLALGAPATVNAQAAGHPADSWRFALTPYLWLPSLDGTLQYQRPPGSGNPSVGVDSEALLEALDFAFMLAGEARRGRWSVYSDYIYLKLSASKGNVRSVDFGGGGADVIASGDRGTDTTLKGSLFTLTGGYRLRDDPGSAMDAIAGFRYFHVTVTTDWRLSAAVNGPGPGQNFAATGSVSDTEDLWDAIVGLRGRIKLAERWSFPYYVDIGAGSSALTWQALAGVSYEFKWGEANLAYRHLVYDQKDGKLLQDFEFSGPMLGVTFRF